MRALDELRAGRMVLLVDRDGDASGDLLMAAERVTPDAVNFMAKEGRGLIRLALTPARCDELRLPMQVPGGEAGARAFTVSIEARRGVSTGISAADRAHTIRVAVDPQTTADDIVRPGHIFPVRAAVGGVVERSGRVEAAVDLPRLAGLRAAGVLCEVLDADGALAGPAGLQDFAGRHGLTVVTTAEVLTYASSVVTRIERTVEAVVRRAGGPFTAVVYRAPSTGAHHVALVKGRVAGHAGVRVHVHRECFAGSIPGSISCACRQRLEQSLAAVEAAGAGVVIYLRAEPGALDGHRAPDRRDRAIAARILEDLGTGADDRLGGTAA